jgi:hypothetical protein
MEAVARRFSATWVEEGDAVDAYLTIAGKRLPVDLVTLKPRDARGGVPEPRLRFDKVATRLIGRLQTTLSEAVPTGTTVLLTITAPIRLPLKTAESLEENVRRLIARGSPTRGVSVSLHGNRVRIEGLKSAGAPRVIAFVHNADADPLELVRMTRDMLDFNGAVAARRPSRSAGGRWLVVVSPDGASRLQAQRYVWSQLRSTARFERVIMAFADGQVEVMTD